MTGKYSGIIPVAYYPLHTAEYATVILASDWLYFSRHGMKNNIRGLIKTFQNYLRLCSGVFKGADCSDEGLKLGTSATHHIPQAKNIPYQPLLIKPVFCYTRPINRPQIKQPYLWGQGILDCCTETVEQFTNKSKDSDVYTLI